MLTTLPEKLLTDLKENLFNYRDGYFELPYLSNSPERIIAFLKEIPFAKHDEVDKTVYSNNIFTEGSLSYRELESGFWIMVTDIEFKRNVAIRALYDDAACDYFFLSHAIYTGRPAQEGAITNNLPEVGWSLYKPGTAIKSFFKAGDKALFINFAFSKEWFGRNIPLNTMADEHSIKQYLSSKTDYITWNNIVPDEDKLISKLCKMIGLENQVQFNNLELKMLALEVITRFFTTISILHTHKADPLMHADDRQMIARAEKILIDQLMVSFPGIEPIAAKLFTSPTKLKKLFKISYNTSLYQYYRQKQMELAFDLLKNRKTSVKDIAATLGYANNSKFSSAFKNHHHILPSEV